MTQKQENSKAYLTELISTATGNLLRTPDWNKGDLQVRLHYFLRRKKQKLCKGNYQNDPILEKDLKCIFLNHENPYLKLGPFKLEPKLQNPEIAIIHDMIGPEEMYMNEKLVPEAMAMSKKN